MSLRANPCNGTFIASSRKHNLPWFSRKWIQDRADLLDASSSWSLCRWASLFVFFLSRSGLHVGFYFTSNRFQRLETVAWACSRSVKGSLDFRFVITSWNLLDEVIVMNQALTLECQPIVLKAGDGSLSWYLHERIIPFTFSCKIFWYGLICCSVQVSLAQQKLHNLQQVPNNRERSNYGNYPVSSFPSKTSIRSSLSSGITVRNLLVGIVSNAVLSTVITRISLISWTAELDTCCFKSSTAVEIDLANHELNCCLCYGISGCEVVCSRKV